MKLIVAETGDQRKTRCQKMFATKFTALQSNSATLVRQLLFRHDDRDLLFGGTATPILADDDNAMFAGIERFGEIPEAAIGGNAGNGLAVDDQGGAGLRFAENLQDAPVQSRSGDLKHHFLSTALSDDRELKSFADFAVLPVGIGSENVPEI